MDLILMYVLCIFSLFLFQPTSAQIHTTRVSSYIMYTLTCFDISVSSSWSFTIVPR